VIRYAIFDLDQTLYPPSAGLMQCIDRRIERYMIEKLGFTLEDTRRLRPALWRKYGTTMSGLLHEYGIDPMDYLKFVHDIQLERYIGPNPELERALRRIPVEKVILSNASEDHCWRVLRILGIESHFSSIFDIVHSCYVSKPNLGPYRRALRELGCKGSECLMVEDSIVNLRAAAELGMTTVLVGHDGSEGEAFDFSITRIERIGDLVASLVKSCHHTG